MYVPIERALIPNTVIQVFALLDNVYEARLFGWVLAKAQSVIKNYTRDLGEINIEHAMRVTRLTIPARYLCGGKNANYQQAEKSFTLANKTIDISKDGRLLRLNIIAFPEILRNERGTFVTLVIHQTMWHALLDFSKGFRIVSLENYLKLSSVYSCALFILVSQQTEPLTMGAETLRKTLGVDELPTYKRGNALIQKILEPCRAELDRHCVYSFDYTCSRTGRGGGYHQFTLLPRPNDPTTDKNQELSEAIGRQKTMLEDEVSAYITSSFGCDAKELEVVERFLIPLTTDKLKQLERLAEIKHNANKNRRVKNLRGYLVNSLKRMAKPTS